MAGITARTEGMHESAACMSPLGGSATSYAFMLTERQQQPLGCKLKAHQSVGAANRLRSLCSWIISTL